MGELSLSTDRPSTPEGLGDGFAIMERQAARDAVQRRCIPDVHGHHSSVAAKRNHLGHAAADGRVLPKCLTAIPALLRVELRDVIYFHQAITRSIHAADNGGVSTWRKRGTDS